jgi:signal transduction histidine kinase
MNISATIAPLLERIGAILIELEHAFLLGGKQLLLDAMRNQRTDFLNSATHINNALDELRSDALQKTGEDSERLRRFLHQTRQPLAILINGYATMLKVLEKENATGKEMFDGARTRENLSSLYANHRRIRRQCREHDYVENHEGAICVLPNKELTTTSELCADFSAISYITASIGFSVLDKSPRKRIFVDKIKIMEIVETIAQNAIDAIEIAKSAGVISIFVSLNDGVLSIEISNTGSTIKESDLDRIFDRGFSTKRSSGGEGIGLFVAKEIARAMGGDLKVAVAEDSVSFALSVPAK